MARPRSDIASRIVHAARRRFLEEGVDGATLRRIARDAGTSIGMVYYYYPTKDDLFVAVIDEVYGALLADLAVALAPDAPFEERIGRMYARLAAMSEDELVVVRMVIREIMVASARLDRIVQRFAAGHLPLLLGAVLDGIRSGDVSAKGHPAVLVIATMAVGLVPQVIRRLVGARVPAGFEPPSGQELAAELAGVLLQGLTPR